MENRLVTYPNKKKNNPSPQYGNFDLIPDESLFDIFFRLPTKTIILCTSVCKYWNSLIKSHEFISAHFRRTVSTSLDDDPLLLIRHFDDGLVKYTLPFASGRSHDEESWNLSLRPVFIREGNADPKFEICGLCNGLVCLADISCNPIILWNPCIRKLFTLPRAREDVDDFPIQYAGLGFDCRNDDYKVLVIGQRMGCTQGCGILELYSLTSNSWKSLDPDLASGFYIEYFDFGWLCFAKRSLHCVASPVENVEENVILGFDLVDEVFHEFELPESLQYLEPDGLYVVGYDDRSTLAVVVPRDNGSTLVSQFDVWVMRTYGVPESWIKLVTISENVYEPKVLGFRKKGEVLVLRYGLDLSFLHSDDEDDEDGEVVVVEGWQRGLISCDPESKQFKRLITWVEESESHIGSYVDSLMLVNRGYYVADEQ